MSSVDVSTPADDNVGLMESVGEEGDKEQAGRERERVCVSCVAWTSSGHMYQSSSIHHCLPHCWIKYYYPTFQRDMLVTLFHNTL